MLFKGIVIQSNDASYSGKSGRVERQTLVCLDADDVKLKNTVDVCLTREEFSKLPPDISGKTLEFSVHDIEWFSNRVRMQARVSPRSAVKQA